MQNATRGSVRGRLVDQYGTPIANAAVSIIGDSPPHRDIAALSNDGGEFGFDDLPPGTFTFQIIAPGYLPLVAEVDVQRSRVAIPQITLTRAAEPPSVGNA